MTTLPRGPEPHEWDRHMSAEDAMSRMVERTGIAVWESRAAHVEAIGTAVINAARELYGLSLAGADLDSDIWLDTHGRMFDLVQQLPTDLVPAALLENRVAEVEYRSSSQAGLASVADPYPHNGGDCHGSRCEACGCCMHSTSACAVRDLPVGMQCVPGCGCDGRS